MQLFPACLSQERSVSSSAMHSVIDLFLSVQFFSMLIQSHVNQTELVEQMIETYFPKEFNERRQLYEEENVQG